MREGGTARGLRLGLAVALVIALGGLAVVLWSRRDPGGPGSGTGPAREAGAAPDRISIEEFVGAEACADCHRDQYELWRSSTHGTAGGAPSDSSIIAPFDGSVLRFRDARVIPTTRSPEGQYVFVVEWKGEPPDTLVVEGVVGRGHMVGGGTQGFFTRWPDGTQRFIPFDWSRAEGRWFCNTRWPDPGRWLPVTADLLLAQCADWPPRRVLGSLDRWANCQQCHGSQILASFDPDQRRYRTSYTSLRVNCESCHGPGREHVERASSGRLADGADIGMRSLGLLGKDESLEVCLRCHATKRVLRPGDLPGEALAENFSLLLPLLSDRPLYPDGRVRTFGYQLNHLASDCYLNGSMTCVSCHAPHDQSYRDEGYRPLDGRFDDGQCTGCHASKAVRVEEHTGHPPGSEGSRCVSCHMPYLQHPAVGDRIRYARSDHTIPVPRPASDQAEGVPNACGLCHEDRSAAALQATVETWHGEIKPRKPVVAGVLRADRQRERDPARDAGLLLHPGADFPLAQYTALGRYALRYLEPDMETLDPAVDEALGRMGRSPDLDLQALALAARHLARGTRPEVRSVLQEALAGPDRTPLAARWSRTLAYFGETFRARRRPDLAVAAYRKALEVAPGDPELLEGWATALLGAGRTREAVARAEESVEADPGRSFGWQALGDALEAAGDSARALDAYREAVERTPTEPAAHFRLGNAYLKRGDMVRAGEAFRRVLELDASISSARVGLAQILLREGAVEEARSELRTALEFEPGNPQARQLLERLP